MVYSIPLQGDPAVDGRGARCDSGDRAEAPPGEGGARGGPPPQHRHGQASGLVLVIGNH